MRRRCGQFPISWRNVSCDWCASVCVLLYMCTCMIVLTAYRYACVYLSPCQVYVHMCVHACVLTYVCEVNEGCMFSIRLICAAESDVSPTYPPEVIVPRPTPLVDLERVAPFYRDSRFPVVTWRNRENGALLFRGAAAAGRRYAYCTRTLIV